MMNMSRPPRTRDSSRSKGARKREALRAWLSRLDVDDNKTFCKALGRCCDSPIDVIDLTDANLASLRSMLKAAPRARFEQATRVLKFAKLYSLHREQEFLYGLCQCRDMHELAYLSGRSS